MGCIHVKYLKHTLISVGQVCHINTTVIYTWNESIIADMSQFTNDSDKVIQIVKCNRISSLYEFVSLKSEKVL